LYKLLYLWVNKWRHNKLVTNVLKIQNTYPIKLAHKKSILYSVDSFSFVTECHTSLRLLLKYWFHPIGVPIWKIIIIIIIIITTAYKALTFLIPQLGPFLNNPQNAPLRPRDIIEASSDLLDKLMKLDMGKWLYFTSYYILKKYACINSY
jgi:hypothetical protein